MAATVDQIAQLRRMVNEPTTTNYSDELLTAFIERHPLLDSDGLAPGETGYADDVYNLNLAAADIWQEKAAAAAAQYDFSANGTSFKQSQVADAYLKQAQAYRSRKVTNARLLP